MKRILTVLVFSLSAPWAAAQENQSHEVLKQHIETYLLNQLTVQYEGNVKVSTESIDPRLQLKRCADDKLDVFNPYKTALTGSTTMGIRCQEIDNHWTLFIPARITIEKPVLVARRNLIRGTVIGEGDVQLVPMDISQLKQGYFSDLTQVAGQVATYTIYQGSPIQPRSLGNQILIHKGQQVSIQAISESFKITMMGVALNDGALNDVIRVKNITSKKTVEGRVSGKSEVRVSQ
ncbi:flagellar basal body P-ring biosynthesis protein FlgA [Legionella rubrilucens]|uniref:Flagella basal body P-ring formation protein FlgA n=1 Tax=Legionella rubrilucens TaxID=458 RepID=A0A0W0Y221_9GAMM|nr:flagellar basal body P-ring formation chaperone FlgA [Legionella rubrilucens]KTD50606.1 flagellar basal body P-ring biosynthesis protein FlgA [Legionella rubrilucens]